MIGAVENDDDGSGWTPASPGSSTLQFRVDLLLSLLFEINKTTEVY